MTTERRTRVAAYAVCLDAEGRILLCRISFPTRAAGLWTLPGGGLATIALDLLAAP